MNTTSFLRLSTITLAALALLGACGGGAEAENTQAVGFVAGIKKAQAATPSIAAVADTAAQVDAKTLFDWAEYIYPSLFPKGPQNYALHYEGVDYTVRSYANGNNLGLTPTGEVWGLGPFTNDVLTPFGRSADYAAQVQADACQTYPGSCTANGAVNECTDAAALSLPTGLTTHLVYEFDGTVIGDQTTDSVIDGPSTFEGQNAIRTTATTSGSNNFGGFTVATSSKSDSFAQVGPDGVIKVLGSLDEVMTGGYSVGGVTVPGSIAKSKTVYDPARNRLEFNLLPGQTRTIVSSATTTFIEPAGAAPVSSTTSDTVTFEAKETIAVRGKTYNTCRYRLQGINANYYTTTWYLVGKGLPVKSVHLANGVVGLTMQLKSGTYNGEAL